MVEVVMFWERGVKQGEMPVGNWNADLNEIMARYARARVVSCVVGDPSHGRHRGVLIINRILSGVCACLLVLYHG